MKNLESWEFDVLKIYNPLRNGHLKVWFDFLANEVSGIPGDVLEAGVFQGKSFLAGAYVLSQVAPKKKIYGYDTFSGFPPIGVPEDDPQRFEDLHKAGLVSDALIRRVRRNMSHLKYLQGLEELNYETVSSSGSFTNTSQGDIENLASYLELENLRFVTGPFEETMLPGQGPDGPIAAAILDCDLHASYLTALEYIWPRLSPGGMIYLDEYYSLKFPGARIAVDSFIEGKNALLKHVTDDFNGFERWWLLKDV